jgi:hypothetical protein
MSYHGWYECAVYLTFVFLESDCFEKLTDLSGPLGALDYQAAKSHINRAHSVIKHIEESHGVVFPPLLSVDSDPKPDSADHCSGMWLHVCRRVIYLSRTVLNMALGDCRMHLGSLARAMSQSS